MAGYLKGKEAIAPTRHYEKEKKGGEGGQEELQARLDLDAVDDARLVQAEGYNRDGI